MLIGKSRYSLGCCGTPPCACASARWLCNGCANAIANTTIIDSNHLDGFISIILVNLFATRRSLTVELTRRRETAPLEYVFQPSQLKYKVISEMLSMRPWHIIFTQRFLLVTI